MRVSISINGLRIPSHFDTMLQFHINGYYLKQDMLRHFDWSLPVWDSIDHNAFGQHFCSLTPSQQIPRMKFIHDQQPLGVRLARRASPDTLDDMTDKCPCCRITTED